MARKSSIPSYRHHKPSNRAFIECAALYGLGKRHYLPGEYNSPESLAEYSLIIEKLALRKSEKPSKVRQPAPRSGATIVELLAAFFEHAKSYYTKGETTNLWSAAACMKKLYAELPIEEFGPICLKKVRDVMIEKNWVRQHINAQVHRLRRIFRWGVEHQWLDASIVSNLEMVSPLQKGKVKGLREGRKVSGVEWDIVSQVLQYVPPMIAAMIEVHYLTGMRSAELTIMRPADIDRSSDVWLYVPLKHKMEWQEKSKAILIGPRAQKLLQPYIDNCNGQETFIFRPSVAATERAARKKLKTKGMTKRTHRATSECYSSHAYHGAIKHGLRQLAIAAERSTGKAIERERRPDGRTKYESLRKHMASLGLEYWHPHQLRHQRATLAKAGHGHEGSQALLGNSLDAAEIYADRLTDLARQIAMEEG